MPQQVSGKDLLKDGDLNRQVEHLSKYAKEKGYEIVEVDKEVGSVLNTRGGSF